MTIEKELNLGVQPLDAVMQELLLGNHDLVAVIPEGLTHKAVQRGRKGRRLTPKMKVRITDALNTVLKSRAVEQQYAVKGLFNY
jgi:hypothetical protein